MKLRIDIYYNVAIYHGKSDSDLPKSSYVKKYIN